MKIKSTLEEHFEEIGNDHVSASEDTPLRDDAFILTDDEKWLGDVIQRVGPGGNFLGEKTTVVNMRS